jgi:hypothetical protein
MNTSKNQLIEWKRRSNLVALTLLYSQKYRNSSDFREVISQVIINPLERLELKYDLDEERISLAGVESVKKLEIRNGTLENYQLNLDELVLFGCTPSKLRVILRECRSVCKLEIDRSYEIGPMVLDVTKDIPIHLLQGLREVSLNYLTIENYFQAFSHLESLSLTNYYSPLDDVSCFRNIRRLQFYNCPMLTDVSSLGSVVDLQLKSCDGIRDVSALGKVYRLDLTNSTNIKDVSALENVPILNLSCYFLITDVFSLKNVYELHLEWFKGNNLTGLEDVVKLFLSRCPNLSDLSPLSKVQALHMLKCDQITHFQSLEEYGRITEMSIGKARDAFTIDSGKMVFKRLKKLKLCSVDVHERKENSPASVLSWNDLVNIRELVLWHVMV